MQVFSYDCNSTIGVRWAQEEIAGFARAAAQSSSAPYALSHDTVALLCSIIGHRGKVIVSWILDRTLFCA
jgi:hypothetical protein